MKPLERAASVLLRTSTWKVWWLTVDVLVLVGRILFAAFDAYQIRLQQLSGGIVPYQLFLMMPHVLTLVALAGAVGHSRPPAGLARDM